MSYVKTIGSRLELFVDDWLIDEMLDTRLKLHSPVRREEVLANENFGYGTVFKDGEFYRMYYRTGGEPYDITEISGDDYRDKVKGPELTAYAESRDGINWEKPELGIIQHNGTKANNFVWDEEGKCSDTTHNFAPFKDSNPKAAPETQYKALAGKRGGGGLKAFASPDGIHWRKIKEGPVITEGAFDSQNLAFWDQEAGQYVAFIRDFKGRKPGAKGGYRSIKRCTSQDFITWSRPQWVDFGDTPAEHLYTNATTPYFRAPHIYLAFPRRFVPERKKLEKSPLNGISDQIFMTSRDGGVHWDRRFMEAFIRQGPEEKNWSDRSGTIHWGVVPTGRHEISLYWCDRRKHPTQCITRGTLRTDGFVSVHADYNGGEFTTKPLSFDGNRLFINYSTSAVGSVQVEIQDIEGHPIKGYELNDPLYGDEIEGAVRWAAGKDVSALAEQPVRLRFVMKDCDIYAFHLA